MLFEPTTLAATVRLIVETLETEYGLKAEALFKDAGLDMSKLSLPGARYPFSKLQLLWHSAVEKTGDQCFGLVAGTHIRPTSFHALGFSWLASHSLLESLERMCRYQHVITTAPLNVDITGSADDYVLALDFPDERFQPQPVVIDAFFVAILGLCRTATNSQFHPL